MDTFPRWVFLLQVLWLSSAAGNVVTGTNGDASCESQLETMKKQLENVQNTVLPTKEAQKPVGQPVLPEDDSKYVPPLTRFFRELNVWLRSMNPQWIVAVVAIFFGAINVWNGPASFKFMVVGFVSLVAAGSARYEVLLLWPELNLIQQIVIAVEAALVAAYVVHKSFVGTQIVIGVIIGIAVSMQLDPLVHTETWTLNACMIWYSAFAFLGIAALTVGKRYVLAIFIPLLGGFLCASALGYLVKYLTCIIIEHRTGLEEMQLNSSNTSVPAWIDLSGHCWLDFASALLHGEHAGIFKTYPTPGFPVSSIDFDKVLGRSLWLVLFFVGMKRQWRLAKQMTAAQWGDLKASVLRSKPQKPGDMILLNNQYNP